MIRRLLAVICLFVLPVFFAPHSVSAQGPADPSRNWLEGLALVELGSEDVTSLHQARQHVQALGGHVALLSPPNLIVGWIPPHLEPELLGHANIRAVHFDPVLPFELETADAQSSAMVDWFNRAVSGDYEMQMVSDLAKTPPVIEQVTEGDVLPREDLDVEEYERILRERGYDVELLRDQGLLEDPGKGNSDAMSGTVAVQLFFVESDGSRSDPDQYTWTDQAWRDYLAGVNTGLAWWSKKADEYQGCWVAFLVRWHAPTDPRCSQWREMVLHPSGDVRDMVRDVMNNFGYAGTNHISLVDAHNTDMRLTYGTDRSYSAFIGYNSTNGPDRLTNGPSAFAYLLGPYTFLLYRSYSWLPDQVFTHETGHIFGACDEYADGCACLSQCTNGVLNYNCELCANSRNCMMKYNSFSLCQHTDGHVGWRFSPCAPPRLEPPILTSISPSEAVAGETLDVVVSGDGLVWGAALDLGENVVVNSSVVVDGTTMEANITVGALAAPGLRAATLTNRDLQQDTANDVFRVIPTTRHYVSPAGGNVFPYTSPATAAQRLNDVLTAAGPGDSVLVEIGTFAPFSLEIDRPLRFYGGYTNGFSSREKVAAKVAQRTVIDLTRNIEASADVLFDGFEITGGTGAQEFTPTEARFGGALSVRSAALTLIDCEVHTNVALLQSTGLGAGGAVHATDATVDLRDTIFRDNRSYTGGALHLERTSGAVSACTFVTNLADDEFAGDRRGGAVFLLDCADLTFTANVFDLNQAGTSGGAMWVESSAGVLVDGGSFSSNRSPGNGGGILVAGSEIVVSNATFTDNVTAGSGAAIAAQSAAVLRLSGSTLRTNSGLLGGAVFVSGGSAEIDHNLFLGNSASAAGAATYLNGVTGSFEGNTVDGNSHSSSSSATVLLVGSAVALRHNLLTNNVGFGVLCSGTPAPVAGINLGWANAGGDFGGCVPEEGWILADPLYADAASGDLHLGEASPAIDAADPDPAFQDPDGTRGDLGWYGTRAFTMDQPSPPVDLVARELETGGELTWNAPPEPDVAGYAVFAGDTSDFVPSLTNRLVQVTTPSFLVDPLPATRTWYVVQAIDADGYASGYTQPVELGGDVVAIEDAPAVRRTALGRNQPNPFNPRTVITFAIATRGPVRLEVYDVTGRLVTALVDEVREAGEHEVIWEGQDGGGRRVPSGVYFYRMRAAGFEETQKMTVLK